MQNAECKMQNYRALRAAIIIRNWELGMRNFGATPILNAKRKMSELRRNYKAVASSKSIANSKLIVVNAFTRSTRQQTCCKQ